ncbi:D-serine deaminase-like pyridoxal phosphate-dependent protein [Ilumatobacter fluminis]|uniref:D-serine deaminase-like pyridoxal phosphate-dependent protein n=1 Tax=Ilumatobacter fluminis TaxID=467091 RepID=A0A4R7I328_9ACTN|nr:alanine racemase [Ilumatobacter fluminis]TDT17046.1 D-serine deaminase-like pyridoxal phosphate-dependent protein [Ilumatobacter fluminis]
MHVNELATPALVIDADAFDRNLATMASHHPGDRLRPHVKAHKCTALAAAQQAVGHSTFTCATPLEVVGMGRAGVGVDLLLANETVDAGRLRAMAELDVMVTVAVDSAETIRAAADNGIGSCLIDVNVGLPRCGVAPERAGSLADDARAAGLEVRGVMGYEGHLMMVPERGDRLAQVEASMALLRQAHADVGGDIVSAGGTGTFDLHGNTGVNEVQAGSYALMDTHYGQQGLPFEQALFVVGTVISVSDGWAVTDVGLKALGMDHGNPSIVDGDVWFCSDEHLTYAPHTSVSVGDRATVIPGHVDPTMAMHEAAWLVRDDEVIDRWPIDLRGW